MVEHRSHSIKPEPIEPILLQIPAEVGQQEPQHLPAAVVEEPRVPEGVDPARAAVEEAAVRAVELVEAVQHVLGSVRVNDVEQDVDAQAVRGVDQLLQFLWSAVSAAGVRGGGDGQGGRQPGRV